jgi:hypothetical protein
MNSGLSVGNEVPMKRTGTLLRIEEIKKAAGDIVYVTYSYDDGTGARKTNRVPMSNFLNAVELRERTRPIGFTF